jgi:hypothetical protein
VVVSDSYGGTAASASATLTLGGAAGATSRSWVSGVGDDLNPDSRTAPAKTFSGALSLTTPMGEISVLDTGDFGALFINKAVTLEGTAAAAEISAAPGNVLVVMAGPGDAVTLRNLDINARGTLNGLYFFGGGRLVLDHCNIYNFTGSGIEVSHAGSGQLVLKDVHILGGQTGLHLASGCAGMAVSLDHCSIDGSGNGVDAAAGKVQVSQCTLTQNSGVGLLAEGATISVEQSTLAGNGAAAVQALSGTVRLADDDLLDNGMAFAAGGGSLVSAGNNRLAGNGPALAAPSASITLQ